MMSVGVLQVFESEGMLEHRLLEYVVLGDFATAVAFLLSAPPESSVRWGGLRGSWQHKAVVYVLTDDLILLILAND